MPDNSFIPLDGIGQIKSPELLDDGEYDLVIESAEVKESLNQKRFIENRITAEGETNKQAIFVQLYFPRQGDEQRAADFKMLLIKQFCVGFDIPMDEGVNPVDFPGSQAHLPVTTSNFTDKNGNERTKNIIIFPEVK